LRSYKLHLTWDELSKDAKGILEESLAEADRGEALTHEEAMKQIKAKLRH
jgi:predicted transcriptional regulator